MNNDIKVRDLVLVGGGHAHAIVAKMWAMNPLAGVRVTLISKDVDTPYSGMLPGLVSGHYSFDETHIDLIRLCSWCGIRFIQASVETLDLDNKRIHLTGRPPVEYDIISINTGSTPDVETVEGAATFATPVKPVSQFYQHWQTLQQSWQESTQHQHIALVGAGAGGFELLLAMHQRNRESGRNDTFHWIVKSATVLGSHNPGVQRRALKACHERDIQVHLNFDVTRVEQKQLHSHSGQALHYSQLIWCTAACAPSWPAIAGLSTDSRGFISVDVNLRSLSHPQLFAAGDIASQRDSNTPKAGVFAVRQGPILFANLRRTLEGRPLKPYHPQHHFLSLLAFGDKRAIASRGAFCASSGWLWKLKDRIDRAFMAKFNDLGPKSAMPALAPSKLQRTELGPLEQMRCGGCGAKVGASILSKTLQRARKALPPVQREGILLGLDSSDDAAIIETGKSALAQSVDQIRTMLDDPYLFAKIAVNHALSDLYAMGSQPHSALPLITLPYAGEAQQQRELYQVMHAIVEQLNNARCSLTGGHTSEGDDMSIGLAVNGLISTAAATHKSAVKPGQTLIITKALGTGVILAANMQAQARGRDVSHCLASMLQSNASAAKILCDAGVQCMTDVTGFGLIGHLSETLRDSRVNCQLTLTNIPLLPGALALSQQGIESTLLAQNKRAQAHLRVEQSVRNHPAYPLLFDPQTSGGLLAWIDNDKSEAVITSLHRAGLTQARAIASSTASEGEERKIHLL
ncbi:MAG: selenide, water dikinase SelD [Pseudomonadales bacterium]